MTTPFVLKVEPAHGVAFTEGYHLGTNEAFARAEAVARFHARNAYGLPTASVALMKGQATVDEYDGEWMTHVECADWATAQGGW